MAIGAQRAAVDPGVRNRVDDLLACAAEHRGDDGRGGDANQDHVIEPDAVEAVLERQDALDLVRLDHRGEHVAHCERRLALHHALARQVVGHGEDGAEIVRRVAPLRRQPGVVEIQPAHHRADVERRLHGVELIRRAGHARAAGHHRARHNGPEQLGAGRILERLEAAGERIHQAIARGLIGRRARDGRRLARSRRWRRARRSGAGRWADL